MTKTAKGFGFSIFGGDASYVSDNGVSTSFTPICISNLVDGGGVRLPARAARCAHPPPASLPR